MAIAYVRDSGIQVSAGTSSPSAALTSVAAGNFIAVGVAQWNGTAPGITITDDKSNTYAVVQQQQHYAPSGTALAEAALAYAKNVAAGTTTITITPTNAAFGYWAWGAAEFSGLDTSSPLDVSAKSTATATSTDANVTSASTAQANELVLAVASVGFAGSTNVGWGAAASSGYTNLMQYPDWSNFNTISFDYKIVSATGAQSASWSHNDVTSSPNSWAAVIGTFKMAASAAPTYPQLERGTRGANRGMPGRLN